MDRKDPRYKDFHESNKKFYADIFFREKADRRKVDRYIVFVEQSSFAYAYTLLCMNSEIFYDVIPHVYAESSFGLIAYEVGRRFALDENYKCEINIYEDIVLYGRAFVNMLDIGESVFTESYLSFSKQPKYQRDELWKIFRKFTHLSALYKRDNFPAGLGHCTINCINAIPQNKQRAYNNRIWKIIEASRMDANMSMLPTFEISTENYKAYFSQNDSIFHKVCVEFSDEFSYSYVYTNIRHERLKFALTIGYDGRHALPLILWPEIDDKCFINTVGDLIRTMRDSGDTLRKAAGIMEAKQALWQNSCKPMQDYCDRLFHTVMNILLFRAFLADADAAYDIEKLNVEKAINRLMTGYAKDVEIEELFWYLLAPDSAPVFTANELVGFICRHIPDDYYILGGTSRICSSSPSGKDLAEITAISNENFSTILFKQGIETDTETYRQAMGPFLISLESIDYFISPYHQNLRCFLERFYFYDPSIDHPYLKKRLWVLSPKEREELKRRVVKMVTDKKSSSCKNISLASAMAHISHFVNRHFMVPVYCKYKDEGKPIMHVQCFRYF